MTNIPVWKTVSTVFSQTSWLDVGPDMQLTVTREVDQKKTWIWSVSSLCIRDTLDAPSIEAAQESAVREFAKYVDTLNLAVYLAQRATNVLPDSTTLDPLGSRPYMGNRCEASACLNQGIECHGGDIGECIPGQWFCKEHIPVPTTTNYPEETRLPMPQETPPKSKWYLDTPLRSEDDPRRTVYGIPAPTPVLKDTATCDITQMCAFIDGVETVITIYTELDTLDVYWSAKVDRKSVVDRRPLGTNLTANEAWREIALNLAKMYTEKNAGAK